MAPPRIAVITPYFNEPIAMLEQGHRSVIDQGVAADHFLIADGHPLEAIDQWNARHIRLNRCYDDCGNTPRGVGALLARNSGYDFIAFLDGDVWYHPGHLQSLIDLWEKTRSPVCAALRTFHDVDGKDLNVTEGDEDALCHIDTSCFMIHRSGFDALQIWLDMPKILAPIGDRIFLAGLIQRNWQISSTGARTVAFRSKYRVHYEVAGMPVPEDAKDAGTFQPALDFLATADGVTASVEALGYWPLTYLKAQASINTGA